MVFKKWGISSFITTFQDKKKSKKFLICGNENRRKKSEKNHFNFWQKLEQSVFIKLELKFFEEKLKDRFLFQKIEAQKSLASDDDERNWIETCKTSFWLIFKAQKVLFETYRFKRKKLPKDWRKSVPKEADGPAWLSVLPQEGKESFLPRTGAFSR